MSSRPTETAGPWLSGAETIAVLDALEPRLRRDARRAGRAQVLTLRQLRYLDAEIRCLEPQRASDGGRLYGPRDVALLRLSLQIGALRSAWHAWSAFAFLGSELRAHLSEPRTAIAFTGAQGRLVTLTAAHLAAVDEDDAEVYPLVRAWRGVLPAMQLRRRDAPALWTGTRYQSAREVVIGTA